MIVEVNFRCGRLSQQHREFAVTDRADMAAMFGELDEWAQLQRDLYYLDQGGSPVSIRFTILVEGRTPHAFKRQLHSMTEWQQALLLLQRLMEVSLAFGREGAGDED